MSKPRLLCVGALTHDTLFRLPHLPARPGKYLPEAMMQMAAGMAASAATSARRQGADVVLWASVGDDRLGAELVAEFEGEGVDCSLVRRVPGARSATATILVDAQGERIIVPFYDPEAQHPPDRLPVDSLTGFDAVLVDVRWPGAAAMALKGAVAAGIPGILDADTAPRSVLEALVPLASHVVASRSAVEILFGHDGGAPAWATALAGITGGFAAVTDGAAGTFWTDGGGSAVRHVPAPPIEAVDTLAAGDVFHGSFAVGLAEGMDLEEALRFASAAAAIKCTRFGGRLGAPDRTETQAFLKAM